MSYIAIGSAALSAPAMAAALLVQDDFWFSLTMLGVYYTFAEGWTSPSITMLQNTVSSKNQGFAASVYLFGMYISGLLGSISLGYLQQYLGADKEVGLYGDTLAWYILVSYFLSIPFFFMAGK
jgi:hypothetical protein